MNIDHVINNLTYLNEDRIDQMVEPYQQSMQYNLGNDNPYSQKFARDASELTLQSTRSAIARHAPGLAKLLMMVSNAVYKGRDFVAGLLDKLYTWAQAIQNNINKEKAQGKKGIWLTIKDYVISAIRFLTTKLHNFIQKNRGNIYNEYNKYTLTDADIDKTGADMSQMMGGFEFDKDKFNQFIQPSAMKESYLPLRIYNPIFSY